MSLTSFANMMWHLCCMLLHVIPGCKVNRFSCFVVLAQHLIGFRGSIRLSGQVGLQTWKSANPKLKYVRRGTLGLALPSRSSSTTGLLPQRIAMWRGQRADGDVLCVLAGRTLLLAATKSSNPYLGFGMFPAYHRPNAVTRGPCN